MIIIIKYYNYGKYCNLYFKMLKFALSILTVFSVFEVGFCAPNSVIDIIFPVNIEHVEGTGKYIKVDLFLNDDKYSYTVNDGTTRPTIESKEGLGPYSLHVTAKPIGVFCHWDNDSINKTGLLEPYVPITEVLTCKQARNIYTKIGPDYSLILNDTALITNQSVYDTESTDFSSSVSSVTTVPNDCELLSEIYYEGNLTQNNNYRVEEFGIQQVKFMDVDGEDEYGAVGIKSENGEDFFEVKSYYRGEDQSNSNCNVNERNAIFGAIGAVGFNGDEKSFTPPITVSLPIQTDNYDTKTMATNCHNELCFCYITHFEMGITGGDIPGNCEIVSTSGSTKKITIGNFEPSDSDNTYTCTGRCAKFEEDAPPEIEGRAYQIYRRFIEAENEVIDTDLGSSAERHCALHLIEFSKSNELNKIVECTIFIDNGRWILRSRGDNGAQVYCGSTCIEWDGVPKLRLELPPNEISPYESGERSIEINIQIDAEDGFISYNETESISFGTSTISTNVYDSKGNYTLTVLNQPVGVRCGFNDDVDTHQVTGVLDYDFDEYFWVTCKEINRTHIIYDPDFVHVTKFSGVTGSPIEHERKLDIPCEDCTCEAQNNTYTTFCGFVKLGFNDYDNEDEFGTAEISVEHHNCNETVSSPFETVTLYASATGNTNDGNYLNAEAKCVDLGSLTDQGVVITHFDWIHMTASSTSYREDIDLVEKEHSICALTGIKLNEDDSNDEYGECKIYSDSTHWKLKAGFGDSYGGPPVNDGEVSCKASCVSWDGDSSIIFDSIHEPYQEKGVDGNEGLLNYGYIIEDAHAGESVCFLSRYMAHDIDRNPEYAQCSMEEGSEFWTMRVFVDHSDDPEASIQYLNAKVGCAGECIRWNGN